MSAQHTQGPLRLDSEAETTGGCRTIHAPDGREIACTSGLHHDDEDLANARLFVAAPDLVAALEEARNGLRWYQNTYPAAVDGSDDEAMARIDAVLAKATGSVP